MRKKHLAIAAAAISFCSVFMCGCVAAEGDLGFLYSRQSQVEEAIKKMEEDIGWLKAEVKKEDHVLDFNEKTFELESKILELEQIVGELYAHAQSEGRSEEIEISKPAVPEAKPKAAVAQPEKTRVPTPPPATSGQKSESTDEEPSSAEKVPEDDLGVKEFDDGNYKAARELLREYLAADPRSDEAAEAMFFIADSYFKEKLYEEAILEYQNIIETWPASPKIPLCQLNQGIALLKIGKPNEAGLFFESLIDAYPDSPEAATAREHLKTLSAPEE